MSVLVPDLRVFSYVAEGLINIALRKEADQWHSYEATRYFTIRYTGDVSVLAYQFVKKLYRNVNKNYEASYPNEPKSDLSEFIVKKEVTLDVIQWLKYANCIIYNASEFPCPGTLTRFKSIVADIEKAIVHSSKEYQDAKWSVF
jgi:hypothetical protein